MGEGQDDWRFGVGGNVSMEREIFREVCEARDRGEVVYKVYYNIVVEEVGHGADTTRRRTRLRL